MTILLGVGGRTTMVKEEMAELVVQSLHKYRPQAIISPVLAQDNTTVAEFLTLHSYTVGAITGIIK